MMQNLPAHHGIEKNTSDEQQQPLQQQQIPSTSLSQPPMEFGVPHTRLELGHSAGAAYPYAGPYFGNIVAAYGAQAMIHPHMLEVQQAGLPLPSDRIEEPVYVNAKQYCGILRRRQSRAKAESKNKLIKCRKPYLHESRHLHALRRARGCGGRFLNTKKNARHRDVVSGNNNSHNCTGEDSMVGMPDSEDVKRIQETGSVAHMVNSTSAIHSGRVSSTGQVGPSASVSNGTCYNHHQRQGFHSSAFHPISVANAESGQVGGLVSNGGHPSSGNSIMWFSDSIMAGLFHFQSSLIILRLG